jgi:hypothetical protein
VERVLAANGAAFDHGAGTIYGEILWQEMCILGCVIAEHRHSRRMLTNVGWAKWMEWKYPVEIVISNPKAFKLTGAVEAAASL